MDFLKRLAQSRLKFTDLEAITKQLTVLVRG